MKWCDEWNQRAMMHDLWSDGKMMFLWDGRSLAGRRTWEFPVVGLSNDYASYKKNYGDPQASGDALKDPGINTDLEKSLGKCDSAQKANNYDW